MRRGLLETLVAGAVVVVAAAFVLYVNETTAPPPLRGYPLEARFFDAPGLEVGAEVRIAGVRVGQIAAVSLDPVLFTVEVDLDLQEGVALPVDTAAEIGYDGVLGKPVLVLRPGRETAILAPGGRIAKTSAPKNVVDQIGAFVFGTGVENDF